MTRPPCTVPGCGRPHYGHGYCRAHHARWRRHGDPRAELPVEAQDHRRRRLLGLPRARQGRARPGRCAPLRRVRRPGGGLVLRRHRPRRAHRPGPRLPLQPRPRALPAPLPVLPPPRHGRAAPRPRPASPTVLDVERAARLYRDGASARGIARLLGTSRTAVYTALRAHGVPMRPPRHPPRRPHRHDLRRDPTQDQPAMTPRTHETSTTTRPTPDDHSAAPAPKHDRIQRPNQHNTAKTRTTMHTSASRSDGVRRAP